jgi:NADPH:quinone reductase-like Zn-dependent oxidoreductase
MLHVGVGDALTDLAERDLLRPVINRTFPLAVPLTPIEHLASGRRGGGKVVITV